MLPGAVAIMALSVVYAVWGAVPLVAAVFYGVKAAVLAIVLQALVRIGGGVAEPRRRGRGGGSFCRYLCACGALSGDRAGRGTDRVRRGAGGLDWFAGGGHGGKVAVADRETLLGEEHAMDPAARHGA